MFMLCCQAYCMFTYLYTYYFLVSTWFELCLLSPVFTPIAHCMFLFLVCSLWLPILFCLKGVLFLSSNSTNGRLHVHIHGWIRFHVLNIVCFCIGKLLLLLSVLLVCLSIRPPVYSFNCPFVRTPMEMSSKILGERLLGSCLRVGVRWPRGLSAVAVRKVCISRRSSYRFQYRDEGSW